MVRLGSGEQQELLPPGVGELEYRQFGRVVGLPLAAVERHQGPPGTVVEQPVGVEPRDRSVLEAVEQVLGEQASRRPRVHEPFQVHEQCHAVRVRAFRGRAAGLRQLVGV